MKLNPQAIQTSVANWGALVRVGIALGYEFKDLFKSIFKKKHPDTGLPDAEIDKLLDEEYAAIERGRSMSERIAAGLVAAGERGPVPEGGVVD